MKSTRALSSNQIECNWNFFLVGCTVCHVCEYNLLNWTPPLTQFPSNAHAVHSRHFIETSRSLHFLLQSFNVFYSFLFLQEVKVFTYENSAKHKIERDAIAEVETRGCYAQQKQAYAVNIQVPPTSPTDVTTSKIVHVKYYLKVRHNLSHVAIPSCMPLFICLFDFLVLFTLVDFVNFLLVAHLHIYLECVYVHFDGN